jgi:hypothetical protein
VTQVTLKSSTQVSVSLTIVQPSGSALWSVSCTSNYPAGYGPVNFFDQVEGVIVGPYNSEHSTFTPLYTSIFYAYIDLVSNYNKMSSAVLGTQTGESSNLYQIVDNYCEQYGSMYLYTVQSNENTKGTL